MVEYVMYLLHSCEFKFVLTRKFASDVIESLYGFIRKLAGKNDQLDVKSTICGLEEILKKEIIRSSKGCHINSDESSMTRRPIFEASAAEGRNKLSKVPC